jgi:hypothetical protein
MVADFCQGPGELRLRLDISGSAEVKLLRPPQEDLTCSIEGSQVEPSIPEALSELLRLVTASQTVRCFSFHNLKGAVEVVRCSSWCVAKRVNTDLHAFQYAVTGFYVKYDG